MYRDEGRPFLAASIKHECNVYLFEFAIPSLSVKAKNFLGEWSLYSRQHALVK